MKERAFFLIKPDGVEREDEIMSIMGRHVIVLSRRYFSMVPQERVKALYAEHQRKPFYPWLLDYFRGQPVCAFILEGKDETVNLHRTISDAVGNTNPRLALPGTIRALSGDDMDQSIREGRVVRNLVHRSLTQDDSLREGAIFFYDMIKASDLPVCIGPFALCRINPLAPGGPVDIEGFFFEERVADLLVKISLIPQGSRLVGYRESKRGTVEESGAILEISFEAGGRRHRIDIAAERIDEAIGALERR